MVKNSGRYPKKLFTESPAGEKITLHSAYSEKEEAKYITSEIKKKIKKQKKLNENDIAILYRANFQSRILEEAMLKEDIPYYVLGTKFFDRVEVKIIMSYIKFSQNNTSLVDLKRIINFPKRGIGEASIVKIFADKIDSLTLKTKLKYENFLKNIKKINKFSKKNTISELVKFTIVESGLEKHFNEQKTEESMERLANVYELSVFAEKYDYLGVEEGLLKFLEDVALISDTDNTENKDKKPRVKLMTIHTSKGLEFDTVFLTGAEESLFSSINNNIEIKQKLEEERRLFYVAMTRAKNKLYIS
ncbi:MAG: ATP-dependent helicase [Candidatus Pacebacteria bacterium]|nr:ATP-dependent helicase [Candidatus Paceibacterota bacterium]